MIVLATVIVLGVWALLGYACHSVAVNKGRRGGLWAILGLLFGVFALLFLALLPTVSEGAK